ncbi:hypothetical protein BH11BAC7_BH11BAC7_35440 [soil metagenome]
MRMERGSPVGYDANYIIEGCAGSGKTNLALERVNNIRIKTLAENPNAKPSFTFLVYTKALREFIRSGAMEKGISIDNIIHFAKWDKSAVDYIVVDEVQDFTKPNIDVFWKAKQKSIMFYGDTQQQVYKSYGDRMSVKEIEQYLNLPHRERICKYRLPKSMASLASELSRDFSLEARCKNPGTEKPKVVKLKSWKEELDYIINEIRTRNYTDVAILLPFNVPGKAHTNNQGFRNVEAVKNYFDAAGVDIQYKIRDDDSDIMELDFDSDLPKVITYHSSKGLQFEAVFIPFCDMPHDDWTVKNFTNPLYVALTRTYRNLYLTHTNGLSPFFSSIPKSKYDTL